MRARDYHAMCHVLAYQSARAGLESAERYPEETGAYMVILEEYLICGSTVRRSLSIYCALTHRQARRGRRAVVFWKWLWLGPICTSSTRMSRSVVYAMFSQCAVVLAAPGWMKG